VNDVEVTELKDELQKWRDIASSQQLKQEKDMHLKEELENEKFLVKQFTQQLYDQEIEQKRVLQEKDVCIQTHEADSNSKLHTKQVAL